MNTMLSVFVFEYIVMINNPVGLLMGIDPSTPYFG